MNTLSRRASFLATGAAVALVLLLASSAYAAPLTRQLQLGMSGNDVRDLQTFLARDTSIYPQGLVTGYFGSLTRTAVMNFQTRNGIEAVGRVGPITMAAINAQMGTGGGTSDVSAPIISNITVSTTSVAATIRFNTNESAMSRVYYGAGFPSMTEITNDITVTGTNTAMTDTALRTVHEVSVSALQPNTNYYYVIYTRDATGNVQATWPRILRTNS